ncbi:MAG TPA: hypothetical protein VGN97_12190 [Mesorhizobium sp.]|jgi:hypothetical protein|nr:hypothetical protein [Mesorhizobium sp.]
MARYRNPWHRPHDASYGPEFYETDARPAEYRGHLVYRRLSACWDIVKDGECVGQYAGPNGARRAIDALSASLAQAA